MLIPTSLPGRRPAPRVGTRKWPPGSRERRERIKRSDEAGDFTGLTRPTRNLFRTARAYREWARELSETDATWEAFERMRQARRKARHRALHAGQRDHHVEGAGRLLPCETTALDSSRVQPAMRDSLPLLDPSSTSRPWTTQPSSHSSSRSPGRPRSLRRRRRACSRPRTS